MSAEQKAKDLGIEFTTKEPGYLNLCIRTGNTLLTSGHTSDLKGKLVCPEVIVEFSSQGVGIPETTLRVFAGFGESTGIVSGW